MMHDRDKTDIGPNDVAHTARGLAADLRMAFRQDACHAFGQGNCYGCVRNNRIVYAPRKDRSITIQAAHPSCL